MYPAFLPNKEQMSNGKQGWAFLLSLMASYFSFILMKLLLNLSYKNPHS